MSDYARWGHLTRNTIEVTPIMLPKYGGGEYHGGEYAYWWHLKCDCGHEFKMREKEFPGRGLMRTCQRDECKYHASASIAAPVGRRVSLDRGTATQVYMPLSLFQLLRERALETNLSYSATVVKLVEKALELEAEAKV